MIIIHQYPNLHNYYPKTQDLISGSFEPLGLALFRSEARSERGFGIGLGFRAQEFKGQGFRVLGFTVWGFIKGSGF